MAWDDFGDFGDFGGGFSDPGFSFGDYNTDWGVGSYNPADYSSIGDIQSGAGMSYDPIANSWQNSQGEMIPMGSQVAQQPIAMQQAGGGFGGGVGGASAVGGGGGMGAGGLLSALLGLGGGLAGLGGAISGGGVKQTNKPVMGTAEKAAVNQAGQVNAQAAQGQLPLQQQQAAMLQALASGQIPPGFAELVARAYDPAYQAAATRSVNAARQAGFHDAPLSSPVGGAIMGPAAAQLQGQQAGSLLGLIQSLPGQFNAPIGNQIQAGQGQSNALLQGANIGTGQQISAPMGPQIGNIVGGMLQGGGQGISMSGQPRYFAKGGIVTKPTNAVIGEAGPEAVIPLGGGKSGQPQVPPQLLKIILDILIRQMGSRAAGAGPRPAMAPR